MLIVSITLSLSLSYSEHIVHPNGGTGEAPATKPEEGFATFRGVRVTFGSAPFGSTERARRVFVAPVRSFAAEPQHRHRKRVV